MSKTRNAVMVVAALVAAYSGATWYVGSKVEPEIRKQVAYFNTHAAQLLEQEGVVRLTITDYKRQWLSTHIEYELLINDEGEQHTLAFEDQLAHGPLPLAALLQGHMAPLLAYSHIKLMPKSNVQPWFDVTQGKTPVSAQSFIDFSGSTNTKLDFAAIDYKGVGNQDHFYMDAATIHVNYLADKEHTVAKGVFPSVELIDEEDEIALSLTNLDFSVDAQELADEQQSKMRVGIEHLALGLAQNTQIELDGFEAQSDSTLKNQLVDTQLHYGVARVVVDGHDTGQIALNMAAKRVDYALLALLSQLDEVGSLDEEDLQPLLARFFSHQPELIIQPFSWKNAGGESVINSDVQLASTAVDPYLSEGIDIGHFFDRFHLDVQLSRSMLQGVFAEDNFVSNLADMLFMQMVKQGEEAGLVEYDGNKASLKLSYEAATNQLLLNNQAISPENLFYTWLLLQANGF